MGSDIRLRPFGFESKPLKERTNLFVTLLVTTSLGFALLLAMGPGDLDGNGEVDRDDVNLVLAARGQPATAGDPSLNLALNAPLGDELATPLALGPVQGTQVTGIPLVPTLSRWGMLLLLLVLLAAGLYRLRFRKAS